jgi:hypothetical protein
MFGFPSVKMFILTKHVGSIDFDIVKEKSCDDMFPTSLLYITMGDWDKKKVIEYDNGICKDEDGRELFNMVIRYKNISNIIFDNLNGSGLKNYRLVNSILNKNIRSYIINSCVCMDRDRFAEELVKRHNDNNLWMTDDIFIDENGDGKVILNEIKHLYTEDIDKYYPNVTNLYLNTRRLYLSVKTRNVSIPTTINIFFPNITHISLPNNFNEDVGFLTECKNLTYIKFGNEFDHSIDNLLKNISLNLKEIVFGSFFNQYIDVIPISLERLQFGERYDKDLSFLKNTFDLELAKKYSCQRYQRLYEELEIMKKTFDVNNVTYMNYMCRYHTNDGTSFMDNAMKHIRDVERRLFDLDEEIKNTNTLNLNYIKLGDRFEQTFEGLEYCKKLTNFVIDSFNNENPISPLEFCRNITHLKIRNIDPKYCDSIRSMTSLQYLDINFTHIKDQDPTLYLFVPNIVYNLTTVNISLSMCNIKKIHLPNSVLFLTLNLCFKSGIIIKGCDRLKRLCILSSSNVNSMNFLEFKELTHLSMTNTTDFNLVDNKGNITIPPSITHLSLGNTFNNPITCLLDERFNNLQYLKLGYGFDISKYGSYLLYLMCRKNLLIKITYQYDVKSLIYSDLCSRVKEYLLYVDQDGKDCDMKENIDVNDNNENIVDEKDQDVDNKKEKDTEGTDDDQTKEENTEGTDDENQRNLMRYMCHIFQNVHENKTFSRQDVLVMLSFYSKMFKTIIVGDKDDEVKDKDDNVKNNDTKGTNDDE